MAMADEEETLTPPPVTLSEAGPMFPKHWALWIFSQDFWCPSNWTPVTLWWHCVSRHSTLANTGIEKKRPSQICRIKTDYQDFREMDLLLKNQTRKGHLAGLLVDSAIGGCQCRCVKNFRPKEQYIPLMFQFYAKGSGQHNHSKLF